MAIVALDVKDLANHIIAGVKSVTWGTTVEQTLNTDTRFLQLQAVAANTRTGLFIIPKGTPTTETIASQLDLYQTDFIADSTNFEKLHLAAYYEDVANAGVSAGSPAWRYGICSEQGGTGSYRDLAVYEFPNVVFLKSAAIMSVWLTSSSITSGGAANRASSNLIWRAQAWDGAASHERDYRNYVSCGNDGTVSTLFWETRIDGGGWTQLMSLTDGQALSFLNTGANAIINSPAGAYSLFIKGLRPAASTGITLVFTSLSAADAEVNRLTLTSGVDSAVWTFAASTIAGAVLTAPQINGTVTTTGLTLPAVTLGGAINANSQSITSIGNPTILDGDTLSVTGSIYGLTIRGGTNSGGSGAAIYLSAVGSGQTGALFLKTSNAAATGDIDRLVISGMVVGDTAPATWTYCYHIGMKFGLAGTATGAFTMDGATSGVVTITVAAVAATAGAWTMTLPAAVGTAGFQLTDAAGDGVCSWAAAASRREWKNDLGLFTPQEALKEILGLPLHRFIYKNGAPSTGDTETEYIGFFADEAPGLMHHRGNVFNPITAPSLAIGGIQALYEEIEKLKTEIVTLKGDYHGERSASNSV